DGITHRVTLAGQDEATLDLVVVQRVVAAHVDLAGGQVGAAGAAHAALAGEGQVGAGGLGGVEDGHPPRHRRGGTTPVQHDRDLARVALDHRLRTVHLGRRLVDV